VFDTDREFVQFVAAARFLGSGTWPQKGGTANIAKFGSRHTTDSELRDIEHGSWPFRFPRVSINYIPPLLGEPYEMSIPRFLCLFLLFPAGFVSAQTLKNRPEKPLARPPGAVQQPKPATIIPLAVDAGTPLKVVLAEELRIRKVGQPIHGKTVEPIYAFDKLLVPAGSEVTGKIAEIEAVPKKRRTLAAMDGNFSPAHPVRIELDEVIVPDGRRLPIHALVSPGMNGVLQFVPARQSKESKVDEGKRLAKSRLAQARQDLKQQLAAMKAQVSAPGKAHRLKRFALEQSPYRPQYLDPGAGFSAVIPQPLSFGVEQLRPEMVENIGRLPDAGGTVHAWLTTPLNSATSKKGDQVEAIISQPLVVENRLYLPEGSELKGSVLQVRAARRFARNGQLRISFHEVVPPNGLEREIQSTLEGIEAAKGENLALDSEGGAQVKTSKTRYLTTGIAVMLAASSASPDSDREFRNGGGGGGDMGGGAANGASGFKLVGTLVGAFARSRTLAAGLGAYGAARSIYAHFIARGRDVVYPKNMSMVIALGSREKQTASLASPARP